MTEKVKKAEIDKIPEEFLKSMKDFLIDILRVFPECKEHLTKGEIYILQDIDDDEELMKVFQHCCEIYPSKFFDILYKNEDMFQNDAEDTYFTPSIDLKKLWKDDISDNTRQHIWKYLQLILFSVLTAVKEPGNFGNTAKLFEAINEDELKNKLEETLEEMNNLFDISNVNFDEIQKDMSKNMTEEDMPNAYDIHEHLTGLLKGKLGRLAAEIAEDTANDLNINMKDDSSVGDVFETLFKNPGKLMGMVKKVGSKLDEKLKSGELKESELMQEAADLMEKMKTMPGMKNMNSILSNMGLPVGKNNSKINMNAFQSHMKRNVKMSSQKERMLRKLEERRKQREIEEKEKEIVHTTYKGSGVMQKSSRNPEENEVKKKKKKKKKRKNKKKQ
mgnify:FL=1